MNDHSIIHRPSPHPIIITTLSFKEKKTERKNLIFGNPTDARDQRHCPLADFLNFLSNDSKPLIIIIIIQFSHFSASETPIHILEESFYRFSSYQIFPVRKLKSITLLWLWLWYNPSSRHHAAFLFFLFPIVFLIYIVPYIPFKSIFRFK